MQRLSDLLNDARDFLPLQTPDGLIVHLKKATIARVTQLDQAVETGEATDPYEILGISPRTGDEELRRAYHELCARHHPDKLASLGLAARRNRGTPRGACRKLIRRRSGLPDIG
jgi:hypothetical protein